MERWASCALMAALMAGATLGTTGFAAASTSAASPAAESAGKKAPQPIIFVAPHQDDETLSMGAAIVNAVKTRGAKNVFVYMYTDGGRTGVTRQLSGFDGAVACGYWDIKKKCVKDVAKFSSTNPSLGAITSAARDKEYVAAVSAFGVPRANIRMYSANEGTQCGRPESWQVLSAPHQPGAPASKTDIATHTMPLAALAGGCTTPDAAHQDTADALWRQLIKRHGTSASYRTMSDHDPSIEHRVLGIGLRKVLAAGQARDVAFYYPQYRRAQVTVGVAQALVTEVAVDQARARAGALEYGVVNPAAGRYGIGFASVAFAFGQEGCQVRILNRTAQNPNGTVVSPCNFAESPVKCVGNAAVCSDYRYLTGKSLNGRYGPGKIHSLRHR